MIDHVREQQGLEALAVNPLLLTATNFGRALSANRLASGGITELRRFTLQATLLVTIVAGIGFLALAAVGGPLVRMIFGEQYSGLGGIVASLCLGMLVRVAGVPIDHFAYPFGHFTADIVELVRRAGYSSAVTVVPGVARASDDRLRLPRILVNGERGLWRFLLQVATPYERLWRRRRAL